MSFHIVLESQVMVRLLRFSHSSRESGDGDSVTSFHIVIESQVMVTVLRVFT